MHILIIHQAFATLDEAGGTRHHELARFLVQRGHRVTIIASPISYLTGQASRKHIPWIERQEIEPGITVLRTYVYPALHRSFFHRVINFVSFMVSSFFASIGVRQVDLVWGTSPPIFQSFTAWLVARLKRVPFLFEVRDLWPAFAIAVGVLKHPLLIRLSEWLERFLYRHADRVIVNSPGFIEHVRQRGAKRIDLVPNGADPSMFAPQESGTAFREQNQLLDKFLVVYAGAHGLSNDLDVVLKCASLLSDTAGVEFLLVGDGKEKQHLLHHAQQLGLKNLRFLPVVPKTEMTQVLAAADACIAILKPLEMYKTTYPNKVFDYMAAGRPVILAIDGVIRSVVESAQAGVFCQPGDAQAMASAIRWLVSHPNECRKMGANGRAYVCAHFDRSALAHQLAVILEEMEQQHV